MGMRSKKADSTFPLKAALLRLAWWSALTSVAGPDLLSDVTDRSRH